MREDLHVPLYQSVQAHEENERTRSLIRQHRKRIDQIERYFNRGGLTAEQVRNLLEGTPPKGKKG